MRRAKKKKRSKPPIPTYLIWEEEQNEKQQRNREQAPNLATLDHLVTCSDPSALRIYIYIYYLYGLTSIFDPMFDTLITS